MCAELQTRYFSEQIGLLGLAPCACLLQLVRQIGQLGLASCACLLQLVRQATLQSPFPAQFSNAVEDQRVNQGEFREHRNLAPYVIREITLSEHDTATSRAGLSRRGVFR